MPTDFLVSTKMNNPIWLRPADSLLSVEIDTQAYTLFPFFLQTAEARPTILVLPGGGYHHWALEKEGKKAALWLNELGYHAIILTYPLQQSLDVQHIARHFSAIVDMIRKKLKTEGKAIRQLGIMGFSAGAHLSSLAANFVPQLFEFSLLCYPVVSLCAPFAHQGSVQNFLGETAIEKEKVFFSAEQRVTRQTGATFLWHTATDQSVPVFHTLAYAQALAAHEIPFECHIFPEGPHGLGLAPDLEIGRTWTKLAADWLERTTI